MARKRRKTGLAPGTIVFTGDKKVDNIQVHYLNYNEHNLEEQVYESHETISFKKPSDTVVDWYDVRGMHDINLIEHIGKSCTIHPLVLEAIADVNQRPKFEEYENDGFMIVKALAFDKAVNTTLGLPFPRTSVDHGTAYDIAGRGMADARGMREAMKVAAQLGQAVAIDADRG